MRITKDTPTTELTINNDKLMHWKYIKKERRSNGKWRYYYDTKQLETDIKKTDRYLEAAKLWLDSRLNARIGDIVSGRYESMSWQRAKENIDYRYRYGDKQLLLTEKYRSDSSS